MSAYLVSDDHINALATFAWRYNVYINHWATHWRGKDHVQEIAAALRAANEASIIARYGRLDDDEPYTFRQYRNIKAISPLQIAKACICFDYQACEVPNYETTLAAAITAAILAQAAREMPGYEAADWGMPDDTPPPAPKALPTPAKQPQTAEEVTRQLFAQLAPPKPAKAPPKAPPTPDNDEPF